MCLLCVYCVFAVCSLFAHCLFIVCSLFAHCLITVCSLFCSPLCSLRIVCSLCAHFVFTVCSLFVHLLVVSSLMFKFVSLCLHCVLTCCSLFFACLRIFRVGSRRVAHSVSSTICPSPHGPAASPPEETSSPAASIDDDAISFISDNGKQADASLEYSDRDARRAQSVGVQFVEAARFEDAFGVSALHRWSDSHGERVIVVMGATCSRGCFGTRFSDR